MHFGIATGLRVSDILSVRVRAFKKRMSVIESKTGKKRKIELSDEVLNIGQAYIDAHQLKPSDALFYSTKHSKQKDQLFTSITLGRIQCEKPLRQILCKKQIQFKKSKKRWVTSMSKLHFAIF
jgi:integrase